MESLPDCERPRDVPSPPPSSQTFSSVEGQGEEGWWWEWTWNLETQRYCCPPVALSSLWRQGDLASLGLHSAGGCLLGALHRSNAAGSLSRRDSIRVRMRGWELGNGAGSCWQMSFLFCDSRELGFFIVKKRKPSTGRETSLLSSFRFFSWHWLWYLEIWGSRDSENLVAQSIGRKEKFLGDRWIIPADVSRNGCVDFTEKVLGSCMHGGKERLFGGLHLY